MSSYSFRICPLATLALLATPLVCQSGVTVTTIAGTGPSISFSAQTARDG
jgi:hypothetical protein